MAITGLDQISNLDIWYKFDQGSYHDDAGTTLCTNGQTIHYEKDFSGNSRHSIQLVDGIAPKYSSTGINSKGTSFEDLGANRSFAALTYTMPQVITCVVLHRLNHFYAGGNFYTLAALFDGIATLQLLGRGGDAFSSIFPPGIHDGNVFTNVNQYVSETNDGTVSGTDLVKLIVWEVDRTLKTRKMWYNNVLVIDTTVASTISAKTTFTLGSNANFGNFYFGAIGELGLYGKKLSTLELAQVTEYMVSPGRWGLSGITVVPSRSRVIGMIG